MSVLHSNASGALQFNIFYNKVVVEITRLQLQVVEEERKLLDIDVKTATRKIELIEKLSDIFEKNMSKFCEVNLEECKYITSDINDLKDPTSEMAIIHGRIKELREKIAFLQSKALELKARVPEKSLLVQYVWNPPKAYDTCR